MFITIRRGVLSISAESLTNLCGILSKSVEFLVLLVFWLEQGIQVII